MQSIKSKDGTVIAYEKAGEGPPMVLVHGGTIDHTSWKLVLPKLAKHFTTYAIDRRGNGKSSDSSDYRLELEFEDVAAVVNMIDEPMILLGHSSGGLISLETALRTENLSKLILNEPTIIPKHDEKLNATLDGVIAKLEGILREKGNEEALVFFLENLQRISLDIIEILRKTSWSAMLNEIPTLPRELKAFKDYNFDIERFKDLTVPTMLLHGSESLPRQKNAIKILDKALPDSTIMELEDQAHFALTTAPDLFADEVIKFARA